MKNPDPSSVPQTEGHPESFPDVKTMPKGWDLSEMVTPPAITFESLQDAIPLELPRRAGVEDRLA